MKAITQADNTGVDMSTTPRVPPLPSRHHHATHSSNPTPAEIRTPYYLSHPPQTHTSRRPCTDQHEGESLQPCEAERGPIPHRGMLAATPTPNHTIAAAANPRSAPSDAVPRGLVWAGGIWFSERYRHQGMGPHPTDQEDQSDDAVCGIRLHRWTSMALTWPGFRTIQLMVEPGSLPLHMESAVPHGNPGSQIMGERDSKGNWWPRTRRVSVTKSGQTENSLLGRGLVCSHPLKRVKTQSTQGPV